MISGYAESSFDNPPTVNVLPTIIARKISAFSYREEVSDGEWLSEQRTNTADVGNELVRRSAPSCLFLFFASTR